MIEGCRIRSPAALVALLLLGAVPAASLSADAAGTGSTGGAAGAASAAERSADAATVQELMATQVDPAADALWDAVAYIANERGIEDRQPRTAAQWQALRSSAGRLIDACDRLARPGRPVSATPDAVPGPGELAPRQIQALIGANPVAFAHFARRLKGTASVALAAIEARDAQALLAAGGQIDEACEACHQVFWYPGQARGAPP